jgi:hypothetical protein
MAVRASGAIALDWMPYRAPSIAAVAPGADEFSLGAGS